MMKRLHLFIGLLATLAFVVSGQAMHFHKPQLADLPDDVHLMYVSRHIYLAAAAMVNVCLGLYLREHRETWRRMLQRLGILDGFVFADISAAGICVRAIAGDGGAVVANVDWVDPDNRWSRTAFCCKCRSKNRLSGELTR